MTTSEGYSFIWKIENLNMLPHQTGECLCSPIFEVEFLPNTKWCLEFYQTGQNDSDKGNALSLKRIDSDTNQTPTKISFTLSVEFENTISCSVSFENELINIGHTGIGSDFGNTFHRVFDFAHQDTLTFGCHIWLSSKQCSVSRKQNTSTDRSFYFKKQYFVKTTIDVQRRVLVWPIPNISKLEESKETIFMNFVNYSEDSPALKLLFYIDKTLSDKHARIDIKQISSASQNIFVKCKIQVVSDSKKQTTSQDYHLFGSNVGEIWHFPDFILIGNGENAYLDDTMFLQCEFIFSCKSSIHHCEIPQMPITFAVKEHTESTNLNKNVPVLLQGEEFFDVELRVFNHTFNANKCVLCAQSPVFSAMFENDMKEKKTGVVEITDVDFQTLSRLLEFLYKKVVEDGLPVEDICKLYTAADKYEIVLLQRRCSLLLLSKLSVENVCSVLVFAETYQDNFLLTHVNNFLSIHAREVFPSPQWNAFMVDNPVLSKDTMIKICMAVPKVQF